MPNNHHIALPLRLCHRLTYHRLVILLSYLADQSVDAFYDIFRRFTTRTAIAPDVPVRVQTLRFPLLSYLSASDAFVVTVVPFSDVRSNTDAGVGGGGIHVWS